MKIILSSRRHHYVARVSIFLVTVALIAGMVGCGSPTPTPPVEPLYITQVAAGSDHTVGRMSDGTVVAVGDNSHWQCDVGYWRDILYVDAGGIHTVGLKSDGTVVAKGSNSEGQCKVAGWTSIVCVAAGYAHTMGLKSGGTVIAAGTNDWGQCDVGGWTDITQVAAGYLHTVGLKTNRTVVAVGYDYSGQCNVGGWTDIVQVAAGDFHTVGLKSGGTVVAVGYNYYGQCDVGGWTDIVQIAAGRSHTVGLKKDQTVVAVGYNGFGQCYVGFWTDIVQVAAVGDHTVGVKSDGTVVAVGDNDYGQCNVGGWTDIVEVAAGHRHTVGLNNDRSVVAAGLEIELARWNLVLAVPSSQCVLTISGTVGGSVTTPGAGTFIYDAGAVVGLVAEAEEGYRFVRWTGAVDTIADVNAALTTITIEDYYSITANFEYESQEGPAGIKAGDWIKFEYMIIGWPAGQPCPEWLELEFLSIEGTSADVRVTMHMSDGIEESDTVPVDVGEGGGEAFGLSGFVIPPNLTTGDSVYISGYGDVTIEGETKRTYAGVHITVAYVSISQSVPYQDEVQLSYYWDKQTGVMVEASTTWGDVTATAKATETNMLEATTVRMPWWLWLIVAFAIAGLAFAVYRLKKRKTPTAPPLPPEGS